MAYSEYPHVDADAARTRGRVGGVRGGAGGVLLHQLSDQKT